jgi:UDP-N-acetylmuramoyl-L-alanyl-D-glutamate--2,6-diaminopimelate ligase
LEAASPLARLGDVAAAVGAEVHGDLAAPVADVALDSRDVTPGSLFFCVPGATFDGHAFAGEAVAAGAVAVVGERWFPDLDVAQVRVPSVRAAMGPIAAAVFGDPAAAMRTVGITGTNGKTTCTFLLEAVFAEAGRVPGVIGTTGALAGGAPIAIDRTTPEAPDLQRLLARMRDAGVDAVAMEVSSHALAYGRVDPIRFDVAIFTNLSQDHLDLHGDMETYFAAKGSLFTPERATQGVVGVEDDWGRRLAAEAGIPVTTYAVGGPADLTAGELTLGPDGATFVAGDVPVRIALRGRFNVANALGTIAAAEALGIDRAVAARGLGRVRSVPGRMEPVEAGQPFLVMVDYAHTPDSIQHVLRGARPLVAGRVIIVFGCGGDRDRAKRSPMGRAATSSADLTIVTSDNPRSEDPLEIIAQIEEGARAGGGAYEIEPDRRGAIRRAFAVASAGDAVIIAGKGHETTQEVGGIHTPFDDREVAREELVALAGRTA